METIQIKWDYLGAEFARLSDDDQTKFFKGFAFELSKYPSDYKRQTQMFFIADKLNDKEKAILQDSLECLWYKEK